MTHTRPTHRQATSGRTLIELLIALIIGFVVLGAVLMTSIGSNRTSAVNQQIARLQQDTTFVTQLLTAQLRLAGYSAVMELPVVSAPIPGIVTTNRNHGGPPVVGCENGFNNPNAADYTVLICNGPNANAPDAINIIYEGDVSNTVPVLVAPNVFQPTDCLGAAVPPTVASSSPQAAAAGLLYSRIENRYFLRGTTLFCLGNGALANPQPVLDNVVNMQITYGVANIPGANSRQGINDPMNEAVMMLRADQVNNLPPFPAGTVGPDARWNRVVSATICLELQSDLGALDTPTAYTNCQGTVITPPAGDTRAYRQVRIQVGFKNRTPACPDTSAAAALRLDRCDTTL